MFNEHQSGRGKPIASILIAALLGVTGTTQTLAEPQPPANYKLVWSDEFDVPGLPDSTKWNYDTFRNPLGWYNNELQYYSANRLANARVEKGLLIITARKEDLTTAADYGGQHYTSARLVTNNKASWTYGFYEIRAKLPCGLGTWPAIWTLGTGGRWPDDGELDILEQTGANPTTILGTTHSVDSGGPGIGGRTTLTDACSAFHNYQMTWTADYVAFGVDNVNYFRFDNPKTGDKKAWPFDAPQYLLLNLAIGGAMGGTVDDSIFPVQMEVDYVRVYQPKH
jgi:beta-glucanase (GH16 family)